MSDQAAQYDHFRMLHHRSTPLLLPNPWDAGSARLFASLGFSALATTSSGYAATLGRHDGAVSRAQALTHAADIVRATNLPVSADLENGFARDPDRVADTVTAALDTGLAGCSIEDFTGDPDAPIYPLAEATERVRAAAEAAHSGRVRLVLTGRAEHFLHGRPDLGEVIGRLQAYQEAGADVLYAPGLADISDVRSLVGSVDRPVNVLAVPGGPTVSELRGAGVARVSVGGAFAFAALGAATQAARELLDSGTYGYLDQAAVGKEAVAVAFSGGDLADGSR